MKEIRGRLIIKFLKRLSQIDYSWILECEEESNKELENQKLSKDSINNCFQVVYDLEKSPKRI